MAKNTVTATPFEAGESNARAVRNAETDAPSTGRRSKSATAPAADTGDQGAAPAGTDVVQPPAPKGARKRTAGKHRK